MSVIHPVMMKMSSFLSALLHYANTAPPLVGRAAFYELKTKLLARHGTRDGHDWQQVVRPCWGPMRVWGDEGACPGEKCSRCGGTGIYNERWYCLDRWTWGRYTFHCPRDLSPVNHRPDQPNIVGIIEHPHYGRAANEALLWLYLLCGEWCLLWQQLRSTSCRGRYWWPLLNLQRVTMSLCLLLSQRRCFCGRWYSTWGTGWRICQQCRRYHEPGKNTF